MSEADYKQALPKNYELDKYRLLSVLGVGGFGVTYLAEHIALGHRVAIKEYLPNEFAVRDAHTVHPKSGAEDEDFKWGLARFDEEARILTRFRHPNLVRVSDYIKANNTAYIVMDYEKGEPLDEILARRRTLTEAQLRRVVLPIADGLRHVHAEGWLHRDIKPGNIYIRRDDETPVLLDFGAARQAIGSRSRSVHSVATAGYSPMEQYESEAEQGPWTDIYSLCAVCRKAITGQAPPEATRREGELLRGRPDPLTDLSASNLPGYSKEFLAAIDSGLRVVENKRPQSVDAWLALLGDATGSAADGSGTGKVETKTKKQRSNSAHSVEQIDSEANQTGGRSGQSSDDFKNVASDNPWREESSASRVKPEYAVASIGFLAMVAVWLALESDGDLGDGPTPEADMSIVGGGAMLVVESEPPGAEVLLGGEVIGQTPLRRTDLRPGDYDISIRHPYFEAAQLGNNSLREGRVLTLRETLRRGRGDLTVLIEPASAWVERDGARIADRTPVTLENLAAGENYLTLGAYGYRSEVVRVNVPMDGVGVLEHTLQAVPMGTLRLRLEPADAIVSLPDSLPEYRSGMRIPEGEYLIVATREGFVEARRRISVRGDTVEQVTLTRREQPFTITVVPPVAQIEIIGRNDSYRDAMLLPPGEYRVRVRANGFLSDERSIFHGEVPTRAEITLERAPQPLTVALSPPDANVEFIGLSESYRPGIELAQGEYLLRVSAPGHVAVEQSIVHGIEPTNLRIELMRELPAPGDRFRDCPQCPPMVALDTGTFIMGCLGGDCPANELPVSLVTIDERFALGTREVTVAEFRAFVDATGYQTVAERTSAQGCRTLELLERQQWDHTPGRSWRNLEYTLRDTQPVVCVSWLDADAYVQWLAETTGEPYRLPSEAEWEYAARAGSRTRYFFGDDESELCSYANIADQTQLTEDFAWGNPAPCADGNVFPANVASYRPNGFGLYDMHGNVFEWVADCRTEDYTEAAERANVNALIEIAGTAAVSPVGDCVERVMRGGSWATSAALNRSANRGFNPAEESGSFLGFRVARSLVP